jgi:LysM repeat protein
MPTFRRSQALIVGAALVLFVAATSFDYTVRQGDTLGRIARDHNVSVSDLASLNSIANPDFIRSGQVLKIPGQGGQSDTIHVVVRGDTLGHIAAKYKSSVRNIVSANKISNPNLILLGQQILIPSAAKSGGSDGTGITSRTGQYHVVQRGESVQRIASQYKGVSVDDITRANGILNGRIYAGAALYLSGPGFVATGSGGTTKHTVRRGDRLGDIASSHGVSVSKLASQNNISNPNLIRVGQELSIPSGSNWVCPVEGASYMNDWGFPRSGGTRYHEGNDMFISRGTPVRAPVSGTVEFITGTIGGLQFRLMGSDGIVYIGTHMDKFGEDGAVDAGDVIGYVGNTGNAVGTRPHLHFGMYYQGTAVNPYPSLVTHAC